MIVYQILPRLWGNGGTLDQVDEDSLRHFLSLGVTHVWYTGIIRHSTDKPYVKGDTGSPYSIIDYYDVNPYLSKDPSCRMREFELLVQRTHDAGMKVIIDFVPNHVSPDYSDAYDGLVTFDYSDYDWTDTRKLDYGVRQNWEHLLNILRFWAEKGVDGFRCDMVEMVPPEFFKWLIPALKRDFPDIVFIAEIYNRDNYRRYACEVGFDFLYDKSGLYDILSALVKGGGNAREISWNWQFLQDLQPRMLNFLENHDEERMPCAYPALYVSLMMNSASFLLYFGEEIGEDASDEQNHRTSIFDKRQPASLARLFRHIHGERCLLPREEAALAVFRNLMTVCQDWGTSYDLVYCNLDSPGFNVSRHYIWTRSSAAGTFLLGANFTEEAADISVFIPGYAHRVNIKLPPYGGNIIRI